jgi:hypothetical protein
MADERGAIDAAILESITGRYRTDEHLKQVRLTLGDVEGHQQLTITLDPDRYPDYVLKARIEVQWYRNDGFNVITSRPTPREGPGIVGGIASETHTTSASTFIHLPTLPPRSIPSTRRITGTYCRPFKS